MTLCIGQLHPITVYRTGFGCARLWCWVSLCGPFTSFLIGFYFIVIFMTIVTFIGICTAILVALNYTFRLSVTKWFWFCKCATAWMFSPLDILLEYWIEHVTFGLLYVIFWFPTRIPYKGVPGFTTDCPCGVWWRGSTLCPLYVSLLFGNIVEIDSGFVSLI